MSFNRIALYIIEEKISNHPTLDELLQRIASAAQAGEIAFYPCSRCTNALLKLLKQRHPQVMSRIIGVFDSSPDAFAEAGVSVYPLADLSSKLPPSAAVVVASNLFHARDRAAVNALIGSGTPLIPLSGIDLELAGGDRGVLTSQIREVLGLLSDEKSRAEYLLAWLARLLNDENLTQLFADDSERSLFPLNGTVTYKGFRLDKLPMEIVRELHADLYSFRSVAAVRGDTVLDVGAFTGDTAVYFADRLERSGKIVSFEPVSANYNDLVQTVRMNSLEDVVVPVNMACGKVSGKIKIATAPHGSPWAFFSPECGVEEIEVTTIDEYVAGEALERVDFIKLDVEGVEHDVIVGAARTIAAFRPKMAVSLYHNLADLTGIPLLINSMAPYNLYLRCRMEGPWSIFLYCEPKDSCENASN